MRINPLRPAPDSIDDVALWNRVAAVTSVSELHPDAFRDALLVHAVSRLCERLDDDVAFRALEAFVEQHDDAAEGWAGARFQASRLGLAGATVTAVLFLIAARSTSGAWASPYSWALLDAAAELSATARMAGGGPQQSKSLTTHRSAFERFLETQRALTHELLAVLLT